MLIETEVNENRQCCTGIVLCACVRKAVAAEMHVLVCGAAVDQRGEFAVRVQSAAEFPAPLLLSAGRGFYQTYPYVFIPVAGGTGGQAAAAAAVALSVVCSRTSWFSSVQPLCSSDLSLGMM